MNRNQLESIAGLTTGHAAVKGHKITRDWIKRMLGNGTSFHYSRENHFQACHRMSTRQRTFTPTVDHSGGPPDR